jgi:uncharacterized protein
MPPRPSPLSVAELLELDEALAALPESAEPMDAATLDGFLTALALMPAAPPAAQWLPYVFDAQGRAASAGDAARLPQLVLRRHAQLLATIEAGRPIDPVIFEPEDESGRPVGGLEALVALEPFALGFLDAAQRWPGLLESESEDLAAALIGVLRHLPEPSLGDLAEARAELDFDAPLASLDEALGDLVASVTEAALASRGIVPAGTGGPRPAVPGKGRSGKPGRGAPPGARPPRRR